MNVLELRNNLALSSQSEASAVGTLLTDLELRNTPGSNSENEAFVAGVLPIALGPHGSSIWNFQNGAFVAVGCSCCVAQISRSFFRPCLPGLKYQLLPFY